MTTMTLAEDSRKPFKASISPARPENSSRSDAPPSSLTGARPLPDSSTVRSLMRATRPTAGLRPTSSSNEPPLISVGTPFLTTVISDLRTESQIDSAFLKPSGVTAYTLILRSLSATLALTSSTNPSRIRVFTALGTCVLDMPMPSAIPT